MLKQSDKILQMYTDIFKQTEKVWKEVTERLFENCALRNISISAKFWNLGFFKFNWFFAVPHITISSRSE